MAWYGFGNLSQNYNGKTFDSVFGYPTIADNLYYHSGDIANEIFNTSQAIWEREDSAYQRMVADMKKAGLNPWTGISSGGLSSSNVNPSMDSLSSLIGILGSMIDVKNSTNSGLSKLFNTAINAATAGIRAGFGFSS